VNASILQRYAEAPRHPRIDALIAAFAVGTALAQAPAPAIAAKPRPSARTASRSPAPQREAPWPNANARPACRKRSDQTARRSRARQDQLRDQMHEGDRLSGARSPPLLVKALVGASEIRERSGAADAVRAPRAAAPPSTVMNWRRCSGRDVRFIARPPPRSVRAAFPHTAPTSGV
jgi:hypothetical protein